ITTGTSFPQRVGGMTCRNVRSSYNPIKQVQTANAQIHPVFTIISFAVDTNNAFEPFDGMTFLIIIGTIISFTFLPEWSFCYPENHRRVLCYSFTVDRRFYF
ncbi:hypothetical protein, partial [Parafilimonas sp.]|uniref:hypothetical protein n=1 Tax=Parafilimonas sp. TaxID=1969739 RepID=UPI0039E45E53